MGTREFNFDDKSIKFYSRLGNTLRSRIIGTGTFIFTGFLVTPCSLFSPPLLFFFRIDFSLFLNASYRCKMIDISGLFLFCSLNHIFCRQKLSIKLLIRPFPTILAFLALQKLCRIWPPDYLNPLFYFFAKLLWPPIYWNPLLFETLEYRQFKAFFSCESIRRKTYRIASVRACLRISKTAHLICLILWTNLYLDKARKMFQASFWKIISFTLPPPPGGILYPKLPPVKLKWLKIALFSLCLQNRKSDFDDFFTGIRDNCSEWFSSIGVYRNILVCPPGGFSTPKDAISDGDCLKIVRFGWKFAPWVSWWCWIHFWGCFDL